MHRNNPRFNPYGSRPPFTPRDNRFRQPMSPYPRGPSPRGQRSPFGPMDPFSPPRYSSPSPKGYSPRHSSPSPNYPPPHGSPYRQQFQDGSFIYGEYRGRGRGTPRGRGRGRGMNPFEDGDCNPGGSSQISHYYSKDIVMDPWKGLQEVPVTKPCSFTT